MRDQPVYRGVRIPVVLLCPQLQPGCGRRCSIEAVDKSGSIFPISLTAAFIYEGGVPTASFGIFTDLRERVRVEQQLAQAQEQLAMSEKQSLLAELEALFGAPLEAALEAALPDGGGAELAVVERRSGAGALAPVMLDVSAGRRARGAVP